MSDLENPPTEETTTPSENAGASEGNVINGGDGGTSEGRVNLWETSANIAHSEGASSPDTTTENNDNGGGNNSAGPNMETPPLEMPSEAEDTQEVPATEDNSTEEPPTPQIVLPTDVWEPIEAPDEFKGKKFKDLKTSVENAGETEGKNINDLEKAQELLEKISAESVKRNELPTHRQIMEVHFLGSEKTKIDITQACIERGLAHGGEGGEKIEGLDQAIQVPRENIEDFFEDHFSQPQGENPEVYVIQVMKKEREGLFGQREVPTDEALIIVRLGNKTGTERGTVAIALAKMDKGVPNLEQALYSLKTEEEYLNDLNGFTTAKAETYRTIGKEDIPEKPHPERLSSQYARGELTREEFRNKYKKINHITLSDHWKEWDEDIRNDLRYGKSERLKEEIVERLRGRYEELLQDINTGSERIEKAKQTQLEKARKETTQLLGNMDINQVLRGLESTDPDIQEYAQQTLLEDYKLTPEQVEELIRKRKFMLATAVNTNPAGGNGSGTTNASGGGYGNRGRRR